jgi:hypothetical protein
MAKVMGVATGLWVRERVGNALLMPKSHEMNKEGSF